LRCVGQELIVPGAKDDQQLIDTLAARAKGEVDFVLTVATVRQVPWETALAAYPEVFRREADAVLERVTAARERRKSG
jgi:hypothetical protein